MQSPKGFSHIILLLLFLVIGVVVTTGWYVYKSNNETSSIAEEQELPDSPDGYQPRVIAAVGDIVCDPVDKTASGSDSNYCQSQKTHDLIVSINPDGILGLGDLQYENGSTINFQNTFDKQWGDLKGKIYPTPGNHEYNTSDASGYFDYFKTGTPQSIQATISRGYYSFDLGDWHFISLNSNCDKIGGCGENSPQIKWLNEDLKNNNSTCTVAFWHHPHFTSGKYSEDSQNADLSSTMWSALLKHKTEVVINGHDHLYERFAPQTTEGNVDSSGIRQFTVGTGGKSHYEKQTNLKTSQKVINDKYGVLKMDLYQKAYRWAFISIDNKVLDSGSTACIE